MLAMGISLYLFKRDKKICYVDTVKVFNDYRMKLELEKKEEPVLLGIKSRVDSLKYLHDALMRSSSADQGEIKQIEMQVMQLSDAFKKEYSRSNSDINEKVWKSLNPEIDAFAQREHIDLLLGANGMGSVLYGSDVTDLTKKLTKFVNDRYRDGD